jgi:hypothetical protein
MTQATPNHTWYHPKVILSHHSAQVNTNNVNKIWALLQIIEGKDEANIVREYRKVNKKFDVNLVNHKKNKKQTQNKTE